MINGNRSTKYQDRNLSEVFRELQAARANPQPRQTPYIEPDVPRRQKNYAFDQEIHFSSDIIKKAHRVKPTHIIAACLIVIATTALVFNRNIFAKSSTPEYELNENILDIQDIISQNADISKVKEQIVTNADIPFETKYTNNPTLPKGEQVVLNEGKVGKEKITSVKTYQNKQLINETILAKETVVIPTAKVVNVGTSEFLAKLKVHIGDTLYFKDEGQLKDEAKTTAKDVATVKKSLDVKLLELTSEEWCKVSYDSVEGYVQTSKLTSASATPSIVEKCKEQRLLMTVNIDMELNKSSGLSKDDFKKMLTGLSQDRLHIFQDNYEVFYNIDKKYNINGVFLASIAIHESGWGTSKIANDKKNLFGYGAYDSSPYESSFTFDDYSNGVETVAKALVKYYLNPAGTKIYDNETAAGSYYVTPTVKGVNTRYASDPEWHQKVYSYMEMLYNRL